MALQAQPLLDEPRGDRVGRLPALVGQAVQALQRVGGQPQRALAHLRGRGLAARCAGHRDPF